MKHFALVLLALGMGVAAQGSSSVVVTLLPKVETAANAGTRLELTRKPDGLYCKSQKVPEHAIKVKGLDGLRAPFKAEPIQDVCERIVTWGKTKACYTKDRFPVLDTVLRWCLNI